MGKSRRSRGSAANRKDPIGKPVKPPTDPELAVLRESKILPIVRDLQSADPKARSAAAAAVSSVIQDARCRKLLLREQVVHTVLTQTLTDAALESRAAGWGILQVLAQEEEADFCVHLYRQDVLTAVEHASKAVTEKIRSQDPGFHKLPKAEQRLILSISSSLTSLLTALAEAGDDILESVSANATATGLLTTLVTHKSFEGDGVAELRSDALACFMILCEDNPGLAEAIASSKISNLYDSLLALKDDAAGNGVLSCGILHNIFSSLDASDSSPSPAIGDDSILVPTLSKVVAAISHARPGTANGDGWSNPVEYQQLALEILASVGTGLNAASGAVPADSSSKEGKPDVEDDEEMGDADDDGPEDAANGHEDDEMDEADIEADMDMVTGADGDDDAQGIDDLPVLKSLLRTAIPELIRVASLQPGDEDTMRLQGHALSALNNLAWSVSLIDFSDSRNSGIRKAWSPVGQSIWKQVIAPILSTDTADVDLATQVTSLAWAVARSLRGSVPLSSDEHQRFISLYQATRTAGVTQTTDDPFQALGVRCIGVLGALAMDPAPVALNRIIGTFLMTVVAGLPDTPVADAVEALNQLFDIYADEEYACDREVFWKDAFLKHLDETVPKARAMVKTVDKRSHAELRARADEAVTNLSRFLAYKRKHQP